MVRHHHRPLNSFFTSLKFFLDYYVADGDGLGLGDEEGLADGDGFGLGDEEGLGDGDGDEEVDGDGLGEGEGVGVVLGFTEGLGVALTAGLTKAFAEGFGDSDGEGEGSGVGVGVGLGEGELASPKTPDEGRKIDFRKRPEPIKRKSNTVINIKVGFEGLFSISALYIICSDVKLVFHIFFQRSYTNFINSSPQNSLINI